MSHHPKCFINKSPTMKSPIPKLKCNCPRPSNKLSAPEAVEMILSRITEEVIWTGYDPAIQEKIWKLRVITPRKALLISNPSDSTIVNEEENSRIPSKSD
ncbi:hypothetical protein GCK72_018993 [Caenorhabditis remanei]|uniref:Uncharacterized protein n=1 Tax=Caenorhabditis remanei TaxID=31234 RepID=A0A6A5GBF7_CAERE|nr:hypothetical protein GCK72_018993 [Caenorhabditis remanei]KAF1752438.1 hypothetical protein GCK72_018993 [Caenorhabditis remanei]